MMEFDYELIDGWRACRGRKSPYLFPGDNPQVMEFARVFKSFDEYIESDIFGAKNDQSFHLGLLPIPYLGNLEMASVYILMLNPGLSPGDYHAEQNSEEYVEECKNNLHQDNKDSTFPFLFLNPKYAWHPGFEYWHKKLRDIILYLSDGLAIPYQAAMEILSQID